MTLLTMTRWLHPYVHVLRVSRWRYLSHMSNSKTHKYTGNTVGKRPNVEPQVCALIYLSVAVTLITRFLIYVLASSRTHQRTSFSTLCQWIWKGSVLFWLLFIRGMALDGLRNNGSVTDEYHASFCKILWHGNFSTFFDFFPLFKQWHS
jgi:hypothetical protein